MKIRAWVLGGTVIGIRDRSSLVGRDGWPVVPGGSDWAIGRTRRSSSGCLLWTGSLNKGYGKACWKLGGKWVTVSAHRIAYFLRYGETPPLLRYTCDVRACVEWSHLIPGTQKQNIQDAVSRDRWHPKGNNHPERNAFAKLTWKTVAMIRKFRCTGMTLSEIGRRFGVQKAAVWKVLNGYSWRSS